MQTASEFGDPEDTARSSVAHQDPTWKRRAPNYGRHFDSNLYVPRSLYLEHRDDAVRHEASAAGGDRSGVLEPLPQSDKKTHDKGPDAQDQPGEPSIAEGREDSTAAEV